MFNPPTHSEAWFWNTRYWVFSFRSSCGLLHRQCHCWLHCPAVSTSRVSTEIFALHHWILYSELKLSSAVAATDKTCDPGRWTVLCEIHIFTWSIRIVYSFRCRHGFNFMFNPPSHSETWFRNTRYWVFTFSYWFEFLHRQSHCCFYCLAVSTNRASTEKFALDPWILYAELKLSFAMAATDKTCDSDRWTFVRNSYFRLVH